MNALLARAAASAALLVPLLLTSAAPALGSCVRPVSIEEAIQGADSVFVGTVTGLSNGDRWATVAVDDVWKGPDLAPIVEVRGGPGGNTASSIDRSFTAATRYLFVVSIADGALSDNACSSTMEWEPDLANIRPATAHAPVAPKPEPDAAAPFDPASLLLPGALIAAAGLVVFGAALVLRRKT
ncbi:MAG: hypothetical protein M3R57_02105 [Chloroflexota bacterium]|nr:hypothetical protein [Chloroflexota bacterium]